MDDITRKILREMHSAIADLTAVVKNSLAVDPDRMEPVLTSIARQKELLVQYDKALHERSRLVVMD